LRAGNRANRSACLGVLVSWCVGVYSDVWRKERLLCMATDQVLLTCTVAGRGFRHHASAPAALVLSLGLGKAREGPGWADFRNTYVVRHGCCRPRRIAMCVCARRVAKCKT